MEIVRKTIENDEEFLRQVSEEVNFEKDDIQSWIPQIKEACRKYILYALSPVQIGIPKRIIYIRNTNSDMNRNEDNNYDEDHFYINPIIVEKRGLTEFLEACGSCLELAGVVERPYQIKVEYYNLNGEKITETIEGFAATVFCHEYDHLNGILHFDIAKEIFKMNHEDLKVYRGNHPYKIFSKDCEWNEDKNKNK